MLFKGNSTTICKNIAKLIEVLGKDASIQDVMTYLNNRQVS